MIVLYEDLHFQVSIQGLLNIIQTRYWSTLILQVISSKTWHICHEWHIIRLQNKKNIIFYEALYIHAANEIL